MNLVEGVLAEIDRVEEILKTYRAIGPAGAFASTMIAQDIRAAKAAVGSGDVVAMLKALKALEEVE